MWIFTEVADLFDKTRADNDAWIDQQLQPWVATTLYEDHAWYRNVGVWTAAGTLYALNKFTTTVASGFVDVLRIGDGVKEGGWGYGKDALRLLMVLGPALRYARYGVSLVTAVDMSGGTSGNCAWVAAARLLRLTGSSPLAQMTDVANASGVAASDMKGIGTVADLAMGLENAGARVRMVNLMSEAGQAGSAARTAQSTQAALKAAVANNPQGVIMFGIRWTQNGKTVGHALIAARDAFGGITIIDRMGATVRSLAELEKLYPGISGAVVDADVMVAANSTAVKTLGTVPTLLEIVSQANNPHASSPEPASKASAGGHGGASGHGGAGGHVGTGGQAGSNQGGSGQVSWLDRVSGLVLVDLDNAKPNALTPQQLLTDIKAVEPSVTLNQVMTGLQQLQAKGALQPSGGGYTLRPGFSVTKGQPKAPPKPR